MNVDYSQRSKVLKLLISTELLAKYSNVLQDDIIFTRPKLSTSIYNPVTYIFGNLSLWIHVSNTKIVSDTSSSKIKHVSLAFIVCCL